MTEQMKGGRSKKITLSIPAKLLESLENKLKDGHFENIQQYVRHLIRKDIGN